MITINVKGLDDFIKKFGQIRLNDTLNRGIKKSMIFIEGQAKIETPVDKGLLRNAYETKISNLKGEIRNSKGYGIYVHEGTAPHIIRIKNKKVLTNRKTFFGRTVNHPGTKANPWMTRTMIKSEKHVTEIFNLEIAKSLNVLK